MYDSASRLKSYGIDTEFKYRKGTNIIQGISFAKGGFKFKGSEVDRKFSYKNLNIIIEGEQKRQGEQSNKFTLRGVELTDKQRQDFFAGKKIWVKDMTNDKGEKFSTFVQLTPDMKRVGYSNRQIPLTIGGVELTEEQRIKLDDCKSVYLQGMRRSDGVTIDVYARYSDEQQKIIYFKHNPDTFETTQHQTAQELYSDNQGINIVSGVGV